jgi:hypothetical protein
MRFFETIALGTLAATAGVKAQDVFEPADFNVTEALIKNGVNVSAIPELAGLVIRSSLKGCSIAVRSQQPYARFSLTRTEKCSSLKLVFGGVKVSTVAPTTYWSKQQLDIDPSCTFIPTAALEVSTLVLISRLTQCPFTVMSGGHAAFPGASSIEGGITVNMANLNQRKLSADKKYVAIGPGNRWLDVYNYLTPYNLAVVGGRVCYLSSAPELEFSN